MPVDSPDWSEVVNITSAALMTDGPDWQSVITPAGGGSFGGYASLTGPGETATPGDLTQLGGLSVEVPPTSGTGLSLQNQAPIELVIQDIGGGGLVIDEGGGTGGITIIDHGGGGIVIEDDGVGGIVLNTNTLSFFTNPAVSQPTVTGSRGGNAALASLLTALAALGLVIDSSTP